MKEKMETRRASKGLLCWIIQPAASLANASAFHHH
jgi:hypothetical protein